MDRNTFVSGKAKQNAVKSMVLTDADGRLMSWSPVQPGGGADITQARQPGLAQLLADGPFMEILADAGYQGMGARTGGRVVTPPRRQLKKNTTTLPIRPFHAGAVDPRRSSRLMLPALW